MSANRMANNNVRTNTNSGNNRGNSFGTLAVQTFVADRAIPIEGATVIVSRQNDSGKEEVIRILKTDASGTTETIELPAPPVSNSLSPGNRNNYYKYDIRVDNKGYYTVENRDVPIFAGTKSIQPVAMLPLPEGEENGKRITYVESETLE